MSVNRSRFYVLRDRTPVPVDDVRAWGNWFDTADLKVAQTVVRDGLEVSTVFLGTNHNFYGDGPPLLFETMAFPECDECERCATWEEAVAHHESMVTRLRSRQ